jgi:uncharacterized protein (TIGR03790 family)
MRRTRWLVSVVSLTVLASCGEAVRPPCGPATCAGCCTASGECLGGEAPAACGVGGLECVACTPGLECRDGLCAERPVDGGDGPDGGGVEDAGVTPQWVLETGLTAEQLGVLVNVNDPTSVRIAERYVQARRIPQRNVVRLAFDAGAWMSSAMFAPLKREADDAALDAGIEAWAITWTTPYAVECMSIGTAFAVGFDAGFCSTPCALTTALPTFDDEGQPDAGRSAHRPFSSLGVRPTMMLASGDDAGTALELIDRGVAADGTEPGGTGYFFRTMDEARSVRWSEFRFRTLPQWTPGGALDLSYVDGQADAGAQWLSNASDVLFYFQSLASVPDVATNRFRPGAVADHLTSYGGQVPTSAQMSILRWIEAGATASYGSVVEPCNYPTKFPNPTVLLSHYYRGEPIIEAYWKSVAMPGEGLFIGEPLATPWKPRPSWDAATRKLSLTTTQMKPGLRYAIDSAPAATGPWSRVRSSIAVPRHGRTTVAVQPATAPYYRLVRE